MIFISWQSVFTTCHWFCKLWELFSVSFVMKYDAKLSKIEEYCRKNKLTNPSGLANCKARNEKIETGVLVKSQKGRHVNAERKVGEYFQLKANGQCSRGDSCSFEPRISSWLTGTITLLLLQKRRHRLTEESLINMAVEEERSPSWLKGKKTV